MSFALSPALLVITLGLSLAIGLSLGLMGGGGSILTVPILAYVAGLDSKQAIAGSLFVVGVTSAVALVAHARAGRVQWRTGLIFGAASMAGAFLGGILGGFLPGGLLMVFFALMMLATAVAMIRGRRSAGGPQEGAARRPLGLIIVEGAVVGMVTGIVGAGGGFLVVPALVLLGGLSMPVAVATSLLVISMKSFAGLGGYLMSVQVDWSLLVAVTVMAVLGSFVGVRLTAVVPERLLRIGFGYFVLVVSGLVLAQELPDPFGVGLLALAAVALCLWGSTHLAATLHLRRQR